MLTYYQIMLCALWGLAAGLLAWYCAIVGRQITYVTLADGRRQERSLPILFRLFLPLAPNLVPLFRRSLYRRARERVTKKIISAGYEGLLTDVEFLALRVIIPTILMCPWLVFVRTALASSPPFMQQAQWPLYIFGILWLCFYPTIWLRSALKRRHKSIGRSLPFVLDLLTLSVEAGMDFMNALHRNVERGKITELDEELIRVIREIQIGKTRREALRDMSNRVNLPDLRSVVNALVQADELGVSVGAILRIQSDQIRQRRFERAERLANEAPVKMLGPLLFLIFPAVFLILLGPIVARLLQQGV